MYELYSYTELFEENSKELFEKDFLNTKLKNLPFLLRPWFKNALSTEKTKRVLKPNFITFSNL